MDAVRLQRGLLVAFLFAFTVFIAGYAVKSGNIIMMGGLLVLPFALMLMSKPQLAFIMAVVLDPAGLAFKGEITVSFMLRFLICIVFLFGIILGQKQWKGERLPEQRPLILFTAVIVMLMVVRGAGLKILGSSSWGGTIYISLLASIFFYIASSGLTISSKAVKFLVIGGLIAGVIGVIVKKMGGGVISAGGAEENVRHIWLAPLVNTLLPLAFAIQTKKYKWLSYLIIVLAMGLIAATGYRSKLVGVVAMVGIYHFFKSRNRVGFVVTSAVLGAVMWVGIVLISPSLPAGMQRAVSFVPGTQVESHIAQNAQGSIEWRMEIWDYALAEAPKYLLIGRGSAFEIMETVGQLGAATQWGTPWQAFLTHTYHSGPIALLIDYGIPGTLAVLWLTFLVVKRAWIYSVQISGEDTFVSRYASYLCAFILWDWFKFYFVFGSMTGMSEMIVTVATVTIIVESLLAHKKDEPAVLEA